MTPKRKKPVPAPGPRRAAVPTVEPTTLRIIGGSLRGRKLAYHGDPRTRPMKDRVREALFNLVGPSVVGSHAIDLFAGTGALGLEAPSRGAVRATFIERHFPTAQVVRQNAAQLDVADRCEVLAADAFIWARRLRQSNATPWVVFCAPPYEFYVQRPGEMLQMINGLTEQSPGGSMFVAEFDERFDATTLPQAASWNVRAYPPAVLALYRKP